MQERLDGEEAPRAEDPLSAERSLFEEAYAELKRLARYQLRSQVERTTLDTTVLVHEAYLKLSKGKGVGFVDREHFMALCARAMRQLVVDHARTRRAKKRGGAAQRIVLTPDLAARALDVDAEATFLLELDGALQRLEAMDERLGRLVELRFFGGYSVKEVASILGVSEPTVKRDSRMARALILREVGS